MYMQSNLEATAVNVASVQWQKGIHTGHKKATILVHVNEGVLPK